MAESIRLQAARRCQGGAIQLTIEARKAGLRWPGVVRELQKGSELDAVKPAQTVAFSEVAGDPAQRHRWLDDRPFGPVHVEIPLDGAERCGGNRSLAAETRERGTRFPIGDRRCRAGSGISEILAHLVAAA